MTSLLWFRNDLRLADHPALHAAVRAGAVLPVYVYDPASEGAWAPGAASRWWLHQSLCSLSRSLEQAGSRLILRAGDTATVLSSLVRESRVEAVFWQRRWEPQAARQEQQVERALLQQGVGVHALGGNVLFGPETLATRGGTPYQVFGPFWRACLAQPEPEPPLPSVDRIPAPDRWPESEPLESLRLESRIDWAGGLRQTWQPGEGGGHGRLERFLADVLSGYPSERNLPAVEGTSRLSPHLHWGEVSVRQVWHAIRQASIEPSGKSPAFRQGAETFLRELGWREFAHHLLYHFPTTPAEPLRPGYANFPWREDPFALHAWQRGLTGYPIVDAGMRELWATGWMHNRVRMIVASFLVKDLLLPWQEGARWFWDCLVDANLANNTLGWQWSAGCGADAAPYFRIFNPTLQGERFDPQGEYVRRWIPELSALPDSRVHRPWEASPSELDAANLRLDETYPRPIVDHAMARERALAALARRKFLTPTG